MINCEEKPALMETISEMFLGYIDKKNEGTLYGKAKCLPKTLINLYYLLDASDRHLDELKENFINHYVECECILENTHDKFERDGLREMYDYIHSDEINYRFDIYTLFDLHKKLYSKAPYPEVGGFIRNADAYLEGAPIDLTPYYAIREELKKLDNEVLELAELGKIVYNDPDRIFEYIDRCVILKCKLIKIHPFFDGNGRSVRGFINKLFLNAGLPSIYIQADESKQYKKAMNQAIGDGDYSHIIDFYYYKICDSIFELDIKPKLYEDISVQERILDLSTMCMNEIQIQNIDQDEWEKAAIYVLERYLTKAEMNCEIYSTNHFNKDVVSHSFLLVYYNEKGINKRLLMDPIFYILYEEGLVCLNSYNEVIKRIFDSLLENGVTSVTHIGLASYVGFFKNYEETKIESGLSICKKKTFGHK